MALLDNLELGVASQGKAATFKDIEELLLLHGPAIDEDFLLVSLGVICLAHDQVVSFEWDLAGQVVQSHFDEVGVLVNSRTTICTSRGIVRWLRTLGESLVQELALLLLVHRLELVAQRENDCLEEAGLARAVLSQNEVAPLV